MARPSKWKSNTVAIRIPQAYSEKLLEQARQWDDTGEGFVQNPEDYLLEEIVNQTLERCQVEGVDPKVLLLHLKEREVIDFLSHYSKQQSWQFIVSLMDWIDREPQNSL